MLRRQKFFQFLSSDSATFEGSPNRDSSGFPAASPFRPCPWNNLATSSAAYEKSPWIFKPSPPPYRIDANRTSPKNQLIGSILREEGHVYSLATASDLLYTGSDSKNIRVWKNLSDFSALKSGSGLVKAIVVFQDRLFTGHQDGKIRIWKISSSLHRRVGNLPTMADFFKSLMNPKNYAEVRRHRRAIKIQHFDAVSCMCLNEEYGLLYSGSWDKTVKVWRVSDYKFLESIDAHCDAVNAIGSGFGDLVFTGSADGTVKAWKRDSDPNHNTNSKFRKKTKHFMVQLMLNQGTAVTALAVNSLVGSVYSGSSDGLVNAWEMKKNEGMLTHVGVLRGHKRSVLCLAAAGKLLFSGSADCSICVWQKEGGGIHSCISVLRGHSGPVKCLTVKDGEGELEGRERRWVVYSGSLDKSVKLWMVAEKM